MGPLEAAAEPAAPFYPEDAMTHDRRRALMERVRSLVVKIGSGVLCDDSGRLVPRRIAAIARQVAEAKARGLRVVVVSSGAIAAGMGEMGLARRPKDLPRLQACAAVGQTKLMQHFGEALRRRGAHAAQILLVRGDMEDRRRYLNIRHCVAALEAYGAVPVINENDTVSVDEIRFGDNDVLAAMVTNLIQADLLVLLTTVEGLYRDAERTACFDVVENLAEVRPAVDKTRSSLGSGGMATKLEAAAMVLAAGEMAAIADGRRPGVLLDLLAGRPVGTLFVPRTEGATGGPPGKMAARRRWIGLTRRPRGKIVVDEGAARALRRRKSLLATGITAVEGTFAPGDVVSVVDPAGQTVARGLVNYAAEDVARIRGLRSSEIERVLGERPYEEVIHADNLVLTKPEG